jgi:hypothetical protein
MFVWSKQTAAQNTNISKEQEKEHKHDASPQRQKGFLAIILL